ncbi:MULTISPECIES: NAD(P)H-dependent oxidoreductase [unclassified Lysobacter]|uniref:FMN-dependent NADH-azoreductase n=1 Tax=unclassified Lysobacter TaxID=2635362 RepID=UPI001BEB30B8|nr:MULTISPECIES: NAD(P)H-dependent oxidoreductase [unclassified Lysobacter]MBT2749188.1 NAD(P)H-dependent oxidoreductase [Lysobacter sp. ISL-42]MBT2754102.1 NAD(P)H-dependent oxidoreductase [Lysobacter sp. ISL-50]MBT2779473.1 NAD(P)H-dependent oxidoreductase [Lysobacter sp. ISL-54]MBT2781654.1 NAD(P)H-dependent oxidoreductase [Lysobacter sp. ISL-52]
MKLLHIDSSALGANSVTRELSAAVTARWQDEVAGLSIDYRDLDADPIPHLTGRSLAKVNPAETEESERILQQFLDADVIVLGAPMYNFGIPSTLKAWIDRVAVSGKTFRYTADGPEGLARGKKAIIVSGRGGLHSGQPSDFQETYLRHVLGFIGVTDVEFVRAEGVSYSPQHRADALAAAHASIPLPQRKAA